MCVIAQRCMHAQPCVHGSGVSACSYARALLLTQHEAGQPTQLWSAQLSCRVQMRTTFQIMHGEPCLDGDCGKVALVPDDCCQVACCITLLVC
jgi:hypothetical protein